MGDRLRRIAFVAILAAFPVTAAPAFAQGKPAESAAPSGPAQEHAPAGGERAGTSPSTRSPSEDPSPAQTPSTQAEPTRTAPVQAPAPASKPAADAPTPTTPAAPEAPVPKTKAAASPPPPKPSSSPPKPSSPTGDAHGPPSVTVLGSHEVQGIMGGEVRSMGNESMGRIVDVIVDGEGKPRAAIIDFGGFLGVGSRKIAVSWKALHFVPQASKKYSIALELSREQVKAAPEYKEGEPIVVLGASGSLEPIP
jgi:hypothetical protein